MRPATVVVVDGSGGVSSGCNRTLQPPNSLNLLPAATVLDDDCGGGGSFLSPSTLRQITQIFESDNCVELIDGGVDVQRPPTEPKPHRQAAVAATTRAKQTYVNLDSRSWNGGTTTVLTPTTVPTSYKESGLVNQMVELGLLAPLPEPVKEEEESALSDDKHFPDRYLLHHQHHPHQLLPQPVVDTNNLRRKRKADNAEENSGSKPAKVETSKPPGPAPRMTTRNSNNIVKANSKYSFDYVVLPVGKDIDDDDDDDADVVRPKSPAAGAHQPKRRQPAAGRGCRKAGGRISISSVSSSEDSIPATTTTMSIEEEEKLMIRRQKNKEAAARCRQRRVDQTLGLEDEVREWEAKIRAAKDEILCLELEERRLALALSEHRRQHPCSRLGLVDDDVNLQPQLAQLYPTRSDPEVTASIKSEPSLAGVETVAAESDDDDDAYVLPETTTFCLENGSNLQVASSGNVEFTTAAAGAGLSTDLMDGVHVKMEDRGGYDELLVNMEGHIGAPWRPRRPASLSLGLNDNQHHQGRPSAVAVNVIEGVAIDTPSNVLSSLSFVDPFSGSTGLTPLTSQPVMVVTPGNAALLTTPVAAPGPLPSCSYQQRSSEFGAAGSVSNAETMMMMTSPDGGGMVSLVSL